MQGLSGTPAKQMAVRLAEDNKVSEQHVYELTKALRPERKKRADAGTTKWRLEEGTDLWRAAQYVIVDNHDPDLALMTAKTRIERDESRPANLPSVGMFQKILKKHGLNRKQRKSAVRAYRRFEAEFPGQMYQIDVTALKERFQDLKTRKIVRISDKDVNENHPLDNPNKVPVWQIMLSDDYSRRRYLKYVATDKITSDDIVKFLLEVYCEWGLPHVLYTDNGAEFKGRHTEAVKFFQKITQAEGGYEHWTHKPYNAQATGKVEIAHQFVEKMNKLIGTAIREGREITMPLLDRFAANLMTYYNKVRIHRATGQTPWARWYSKRAVIRRLPAEVVKSALLCDKFDSRIIPSMEIERGTVKYKLPSDPFVNYPNYKIKVIIPNDIDYIIVGIIGKNKEIIDEFIVDKVISTPDLAGDFHQHAESIAQNFTKRLHETRKTEVVGIKQQTKLTGEIAPLPFVDIAVEPERSTVRNFPHAEIQITAETVAAVAVVPSQLVAAKEMSYWEAVATFADRFDDVDDAKEFFKTIFGDGEVIAEIEIETAIANRQDNQQPARIYAVK